MRCVAAILARNEADRYLRDTVESLRLLCDEILLLDDNSTDETVALANSLGVRVRLRKGKPMWGQESGARRELWEWGAGVAKDGWLYISDADHITHADPVHWKTLLTSWNVDAWAFPLYDLWDSPETYRADGYWQGYQHPRPWLFKPSVAKGFAWNERGIHCGHAPNAPWKIGVSEQVWIAHYGWMKAEDRVSKHSQYAKESGILSDFERDHLSTVLD